ncbi:MAG: hypothetical protein HY088_06825 [Ignavibacteriales bacterium]|nr:hypothetical protein [Ignavibacteriales bacterium]
MAYPKWGFESPLRHKKTNLADLAVGRQARPDDGASWTQNSACPVPRDLAYPKWGFSAIG